MFLAWVVNHLNLFRNAMGIMHVIQSFFRKDKLPVCQMYLEILLMRDSISKGLAIKSSHKYDSISFA